MSSGDKGASRQDAVLVTGGAGYIGSHACKALAAAGFVPVTYDNMGRGHRSAVKWGPLEEGDLADGARLREAIRRHRPCAVMHFAAYAYVGESVKDPALYYANNVLGSSNLLEVMRAEGVRNVVFSSTCAVYGEGHDQPIPETAALAPVSPYGVTKYLIERMLTDYQVAYGFRTIALRYFNAAGADPDGEIGERHEPETHLIPLVLEAAAGRGPGLKVFGDDYPTPDGTCVRDYVHVTDLADAHVRALRQLLEDTLGGALNLGTGRGYSVKQVLETARRVTGCEVPHLIVARRPGDPPYAVGDASRVKAVLGWTPRYSDLAEIVRTAWGWMRGGVTTAGS